MNSITTIGLGIALSMNLLLVNLVKADPSHECLFDVNSDHSTLAEAIQDREADGHICLTIGKRYFNSAIVDEKAIQLIDGSMIECRYLQGGLIPSWKEEYELHLTLGSKQVNDNNIPTLLVQDCEILYN